MRIAKQSYRMMGTIIDVQIEAHDADDLLKWVELELKRYNLLMSANQEDSGLMMINHQAGIKAVGVNHELYHLIKLGLSYSLEKGSALNICIGPLVQLWRIGFNDAKVPSSDEIEKALALTNPQAVVLDDENQSVYLQKRGMKLDLGCLAKGYIADSVMRSLKGKHVTSAMINLGGNVLVYGKAPSRDDGLWRVGIINPNIEQKQNLRILKVSNQSVVTSGINERKHQKYHHIFDRTSGYPIESDVASLTIIANSSLLCEVYTTLLFGNQSEDIIKRVQEISDIECIVVKKDGTVLSSTERLFI